MTKGGPGVYDKMFASQRRRCSISFDVGKLVANRRKGNQSVIIAV
jgi:hypothetical protein